MGGAEDQEEGAAEGDDGEGSDEEGSVDIEEDSEGEEELEEELEEEGEGAKPAGAEDDAMEVDDHPAQKVAAK